MNKQLTTKTIGIAASAALIASLAFSGSAFAGKGWNNGQKGSISVQSVCYLNDDKSLTVKTIIMDASSRLGDAMLDSMTVQAMEKYQGKWSDPANSDTVGAPAMVDPVFTTDPYFANCDPVSCNEVTIPVCPGLTDDAKSVNAVIDVWIKGEHNNKEYDEVNDISRFTARCSDDPATEEHEVAALNVWVKNGNFCDL